MVGYLKILSEMISMEIFMLCIIAFSLFLTVSNIGLLKTRDQKKRNWMIVIRCLGAVMLFLIILYILLLVLSGRFGDLIAAIGNHPAVIIFFLLNYITGKIYQRRSEKIEQNQI